MQMTQKKIGKVRGIQNEKKSIKQGDSLTLLHFITNIKNNMMKRLKKDAKLNTVIGYRKIATCKIQWFFYIQN